MTRGYLGRLKRFDTLTLAKSMKSPKGGKTPKAKFWSGTFFPLKKCLRKFTEISGATFVNLAK